MAALNQTLRPIAAKLMAQFGGEATIRQVTPGVYDTTTGTVSETVVDKVVRGVLTNVTSRDVNDLVLVGDRELTIAASDLTTPPTSKDRVLIQGEEMQVIIVKTEEQDNVPIIYTLVLRS